ncbi:hypothetical protein FHL15_009428 [Xylaria flabelliformis]|uniref:Uncharacterized protein n=1 Tax=Xylaria flabelliformis TaxID=2512241 RepID=A0A553HNY5_9PEZI|nr:hypothetical protein FHL15_009428 [Xylaria flabelliformis]
MLIDSRPSHKENPCEPHSTASPANPTLGTESEPELCENLSAIATQRAQLAFSADEMTPLERYYCHVETYEQLVMGQIGDRQSFTRLNELDTSLDAATKLLGGITPQASTSSWSMLSSLCEDTNMTPALELDHLILLNDSPEWQAVPQEEQAKHLHKIAKLRRRVKAEGNPRNMKSVRVRKRGKNNHVSNEAMGNNSAI